MDYEVSGIRFDFGLRSDNTIRTIDSLINLKDQNILASDIIMRYTEELWKKSLKYIRRLALFHLIMTITLTLHILYIDNQYQH